LLGFSTKQIYLDSSSSDENLTLLDSVFPILFSIPLLLKFSKTKVTENSEIQYDIKKFDKACKNLDKKKMDKAFLFNLFFNYELVYQKDVPPLGWYERTKLIILRNLIPLIFAIYFIINTADAAKYEGKNSSAFFLTYTILNALMIGYIFTIVCLSVYSHIFPFDEACKIEKEEKENSII
jgi:hypothetical protein